VGVLEAVAKTEGNVDADVTTEDVVVAVVRTTLSQQMAQ